MRITYDLKATQVSVGFRLKLYVVSILTLQRTATYLCKTTVIQCNANIYNHSLMFTLFISIECSTLALRSLREIGHFGSCEVDGKWISRYRLLLWHARLSKLLHICLSVNVLLVYCVASVRKKISSASLLLLL